MMSMRTTSKSGNGFLTSIFLRVFFALTLCRSALTAWLPLRGLLRFLVDADL